MAEGTLTTRQQEARDTVRIDFEHHSPGRTSPMAYDSLVRNLDSSVSFLPMISQQYCDRLRHLPDIKAARTQDSDFLVFTAVIFQRSDCRNVYVKRDMQDQWRTPTLKDLFSTTELNEAIQTGQRLTIPITLEWTWIALTQTSGLRDVYQPSIRFWCPNQYFPGPSGRWSPEGVLPSQAHPNSGNVAVLNMAIPPKGPCNVSFHEHGDQAKVQLDQHMSALYGRGGIPKLTFQSYTPWAADSSSNSGTSLQLSVRLINQMQSVGLGRVSLPLQLRIDLVSCEVTATKIRKSITYALDQMKRAIDQGKPTDDLSRVRRLFDPGASNKWIIEL